MARFGLKPLFVLPLLCLFATGAKAATLVADGVSYSLIYSIINPSTRTFTLNIWGINGPNDTEKGRYGVGSFAFNDPGSSPIAPTSWTAPSGFTYEPEGLNASGCNSSGNFFCFLNNTIPTGPVLAQGSSLSYTFQISLDPTAFPSSYTPDFKIEWIGSKTKFNSDGSVQDSGYDLVSQTIDPVAAVPLPASGLLLIGALGGLGLMRRRRKVKAV